MILKVVNFCLLLVLLACFLSVLDMAEKGMKCSKDQRTVLKFLVASGNKPIDCWRKLHEVYGDDCLSKTQVRMWHRRICGGDLDVSDKARSGRPVSKCTAAGKQAVQAVLDQNRRVSC